MMLDFDDFENDAGYWKSFNMLLDFDGFGLVLDFDDFQDETRF